MDRKTFRSCAKLLCLAALLLLLILRPDGLFSVLGRIIHTFKPVFFGFALAFILSRPCRFFERLYGRLLPRAKSGLTTALGVLTSYLGLLVIVTLIFTMILPQLYESIRGLAARIYANLPAMQTAFNDLLTRFNLDSTELAGKLPPLSTLVDGVLGALSSALPHQIGRAHV